MADNTTRNATSGGDVIRDIDRSGVKSAVAVLDVGGSTAERFAGSTQKDSGNWAMWVDLRPASALIQVASTGLTTASTAYVTGDALGQEMVFAAAARAAGDLGRISGAVLVDKAKVLGAVDLFLFDRSVTPAADNGANSWSDADALFLVGVIEFPAPKQSANNYLAQAFNIPLTYRCNATSLYGYLVTRSGHTFFGAVGDVVVSLLVEAD